MDLAERVRLPEADESFWVRLKLLRLKAQTGIHLLKLEA